MIPLLHPKAVYAKRRERLAASLEPGRFFVNDTAATEKVRNYDSHYAYRPDSHFLYLTGFAEPGSAFLMWRDRNSRGGAGRTRFEIFTLPRDPSQEQWDGFRYGPARAAKMTGADGGTEIADLEEMILAWLEKVPPKGVGPRVLTNAWHEGESKAFLDSVLSGFHPRMRAGRHDLEAVIDVLPRVQSQRVIKDPGELKVMRESSRINVAAHLKLMHELHPGMREFQARAILEAEFMRQGALDVAYGTIAASGANATILHYRAGHRAVKDGELLLVDAGCEYGFYASDITRTLPANGQYSKPQRLIMDLVMEAHAEAMSQAVAGRPYKNMHQAASDTLREGLKKLKLLPKGIEHTRYYPHGTGHWLGLDVHDPCHYLDEKGESLKLKPGMVMTIEPGLYFMANDKTVPEEFRGIGVRIEDDVVISSRGKPEVLTSGLPRSADEIEKAMKKRRAR